MGRLVYFLAGAGTMNAGRAHQLGLGYALDGRGVAYVGMTRGPGGASGVLFGRSETPLTNVEGLRWAPYPGQSRLHVGWDAGNAPGPGDLARRKQLQGHAVELADGQRWLVPVARHPHGDSPLPRRLEWSGSAGWAPGEVIESRRALWEGACRAWDTLSGQVEEDGALLVSDGAELAVMALSANYRVSQAEVSALGLLDTETSAEVLKALVDWPAIEELMAARSREGNAEGPAEVVSVGQPGSPGSEG